MCNIGISDTLEFHRRILVVRVASCIFQHARPGTVAAIVWSQPNGRRHRRFQLDAVGQNATPGTMLWVSMVDAALLLVGGLYYFRRMERTFADVS